MGDAVDIPLEAGADRALLLRDEAAARILGQHPEGADHQMFQPLPLFSRTGHGQRSLPLKHFLSHTLYTTQIRISLYFFIEIFWGVSRNTKSV